MRPHRDRGPRPVDRGSVTAEAAVALPALLLVLAVLIGALNLALAQIRCVDAARIAARGVARGESGGTSGDQARSAAPPGATVRISRGGDLVQVEVSVRLRPVKHLPLPAVLVRGTANALVEAEPLAGH